MKRFQNEIGETQIGIIIGALVLGCLCWATFTLQGCIKETVDSRTMRKQAQDRAGKPMKFEKVKRSYKVRY